MVGVRDNTGQTAISGPFPLVFGNATSISVWMEPNPICERDPLDVSTGGCEIPVVIAGGAPPYRLTLSMPGQADLQQVLIDWGLEWTPVTLVNGMWPPPPPPTITGPPLLRLRGQNDARLGNLPGVFVITVTDSSTPTPRTATFTTATPLTIVRSFDFDVSGAVPPFLEAGVPIDLQVGWKDGIPGDVWSKTISLPVGYAPINLVPGLSVRNMADGRFQIVGTPTIGPPVTRGSFRYDLRGRSLIFFCCCWVGGFFLFF